MQIRARVPLWAIESFGDRIKKSISYWISFQLKPRQDMTIHTARLGCNLFLGLFFSQLGKVTGNRNWFIHSFHCCVLHFNFSMTDFIIPPHPIHFLSILPMCSHLSRCSVKRLEPAGEGTLMTSLVIHPSLLLPPVSWNCPHQGQPPRGHLKIMRWQKLFKNTETWNVWARSFHSKRKRTQNLGSVSSLNCCSIWNSRSPSPSQKNLSPAQLRGCYLVLFPFLT